MSFSTFQGPVRAGTVRSGAAANTGLLILCQYVTNGIPGTSATIVLPAGSRVIEIFTDTLTAYTGGTALITITGSDSRTYSASTGRTVVSGSTRVWYDATGTAMQTTLSNWNAQPASADDVTLTFTVTGTASAGGAVSAVLYAQRVMTSATTAIEAPAQA